MHIQLFLVWQMYVQKPLTENTEREGEKRNKERVGNSEYITALKIPSSDLSSFW
jgi:hypothetical protein